MSDEPEFSIVPIIERLPLALDRETQDDGFPIELTGARIVKIGTIDAEWIAGGGGLAIEYQPHGEQETKRIVIGFSELGAWIEFCGTAESSAACTCHERDSSRVCDFCYSQGLRGHMQR